MWEYYVQTNCDITAYFVGNNIILIKGLFEDWKHLLTIFSETPIQAAGNLGFNVWPNRECVGEIRTPEEMVSADNRGV